MMHETKSNNSVKEITYRLLYHMSAINLVPRNLKTEHLFVIIMENLEKGNIELLKVDKEIKIDTDIDIDRLILTNIK